MQSPNRPATPRPAQDDLDMSALTSTEPSPRNPSSPVRFATTKNAFGLSASPSSSSSSGARDDRTLLIVDQSPTSSGSASKPRLRRPSMLSLAQTASFGSEGEGGTEEMLEDNTGSGPPISPTRLNPISSGPAISPTRTRQLPSNPFAPNPLRLPPQWGPSGFSFRQNRQGSASRLSFEGLSTTTPPNAHPDRLEDQSGMDEADMEDQRSKPDPPLRWMPSHLQTASARRKGKARMDDNLISDPTPQPEIHKPPFTGRPLPASLLATLMSESAPGDHEIQSEARLQRLISSHPRALPFTPRAPRSSRGRFPETVGDDDDDDDFPNRRAIWAARAWTRRDSSSDSDSDDIPMDDPAPEPVNSAFAAGMDMGMNSAIDWQGGGTSESGKSTPGMIGSNGYPTPPSNGQAWDRGRAARMSFSMAGLVPSPGTGFGLPNAFGGLGMGTGTPMGSPTIEKLELAASPSGLSAMSTASPSLMAYRESTGGSASVRPGKRKAQADDRFDPYKRPRGSSPSFSTPGYPMSPSRSTPAIPIPQSPGYSLYPTGREQINLRTKPNHPYTRPMSSRSRAASPALSIGSTSGGLGSSLGTPAASATRGSFSLAGAFVPGGNGAGSVQPPPPALGSLGLLSLANRGDEVEVIREEGEGEEMRREDSGRGSAMDED